MVDRPKPKENGIWACLDDVLQIIASEQDNDTQGEWHTKGL